MQSRPNRESKPRPPDLKSHTQPLAPPREADITNVQRFRMAFERQPTDELQESNLKKKEIPVF